MRPYYYVDGIPPPRRTTGITRPQSAWSGIALGGDQIWGQEVPSVQVGDRCIGLGPGKRNGASPCRYSTSARTGPRPGEFPCQRRGAPLQWRWSRPAMPAPAEGAPCEAGTACGMRPSSPRSSSQGALTDPRRDQIFSFRKNICIR